MDGFFALKAATGGGGASNSASRLARTPRYSPDPRNVYKIAIYDFLIEKYENKNPSKTLINIASHPVLIENKVEVSIFCPPPSTARFPAPFCPSVRHHSHFGMASASLLSSADAPRINRLMKSVPNKGNFFKPSASGWAFVFNTDKRRRNHG